MARMFGWFKRRKAPEGPIEVELDLEIERPACEVYPLVDFADPRHHKAEVGTITRTAERSFDLVVDMLPDLTFPVEELAASPDRVYSYKSILPVELGTPLLYTIETYWLEPAGENRCKVTFSLVGHFRPMTMKEYRLEVARIAAASNNTLAKLKIYAEQGVEAIRAIEAQQAA
ncbi:hypothetical protein [Aurantiacibacter poecillastricola]|uniref:hypothetical protein n=1 Tax=Aurantiacibacter poecillastricola TaxID=3064385 RepID=UPI00273E47A2|nr:hypothetical protein [Aurantiacibacter sp. 219JJ12-13]MDP5260777.1 hypothetical protein [Aurantiacibacter sp. 219JJ12-13]